jgi:hypothetical protein
MKYALLVHQTQEHFDKRDDAAVAAAGRAYGEALQAAGVFVAGGGLQPPTTATTVTARTLVPQSSGSRSRGRLPREARNVGRETAR